MQEKTVVITGASAGIGARLAQVLGQRGKNVVLAARRQRQLDAVSADCGERAMVVKADVTHRVDISRILDAAIERFGQIDVWVNNAGRGISRPVAELTDDDFDEMMLVNVKSALYGMQAVLPHFKSRRRGQIINVSSLLGRIPYVSIRSAYSAAKHALNALTTNLRMDLRQQYPEIFVNLVMPGPVATDFGTSSLHGGPDSRKLPTAQDAGEVAALIAELIERPRAELYTRPQYQQQVAAYYAADDVAAIESEPPFLPATSRLFSSRL